MMKRSISLVVLAVCSVAATAHAVTFGWQELPEGGIEYIVQVEPALYDAFREVGFHSEIPEGTPPFRRIKLKVGQDKLPNEGSLPPPAAMPPQQQQQQQPSAETEAAKQDLQAGKEGRPESADQPANFHEPMGAKPLYNGPFSAGFDRREETPVPDSTSNPPAEDTKEAAAPETLQKPVIGDTDAARPWIPFMAALVALFASVGANAYMVWIHQSLRSNYRALLARMNRGASAA